MTLVVEALAAMVMEVIASMVMEDTASLVGEDMASMVMEEEPAMDKEDMVAIVMVDMFTEERTALVFKEKLVLTVKVDVVEIIGMVNWKVRLENLLWFVSIFLLVYNIFQKVFTYFFWQTVLVNTWCNFVVFNVYFLLLFHCLVKKC